MGNAVPGRAALTMAFTPFVLYQLYNALNARADDGPLLGRHQLRNRTPWLCLAGVLCVQIIAVHLSWARTVFGTVPLDATQWALCLATASTVLLTEWAMRLLRPRRVGQPAAEQGATG
jgi:Ca2+-transporting ATPase